MLVRRQWNASHIAEKSAFRTSAPWLNCCQQANALIELGRRTKISPQKRACDGRFDSSPRADFTDVPKRVSPTADVEICLPRDRFRTSLHKRLAAVERGEVSVQFPHRASRFGDRMPLLELCGAMAVIRCVSCELQYFLAITAQKT
jgi:hypothetical protein